MSFTCRRYSTQMSDHNTPNQRSLELQCRVCEITKLPAFISLDSLQRKKATKESILQSNSINLMVYMIQ